MNKETQKIIETIVDASSHSEETKKSLRYLLESIYINGEIAGIQQAREIVNTKV